MRVRSFFTNIRGRIQEKKKRDPLGSYLAICIQEALRENAKLLRVLFPSIDWTKVASIEKEHRYNPDTRRLADLALLDDDDEPLLIVEVKVLDSLTEPQAKDYAAFSRKRACPLVVLTRFPLSEREVSWLKGADLRVVLLSDLYRIIRDSGGPRWPVTQLLAQYLQENEMIYTRLIDRSLGFLLFRIFVGSEKSHKLSFGGLSEDLPDTLNRLFCTLRVLGDAINERLRVRGSQRRRNVTVDMWLHPWIDTDRLADMVKNAQHPRKKKGAAKPPPPAQEVYIGHAGAKFRSGHARIYTSLQVSDSSRQTYLCFGFGIQVDKANGVEVALYTWVTPDKDDKFDREMRVLKTPKRGRPWDLGDPGDLENELVSALKNSIAKYIKHYGAKDPKTHPRETKCAKDLRRLNFD